MAVTRRPLLVWRCSRRCRVGSSRSRSAPGMPPCSAMAGIWQVSADQHSTGDTAREARRWRGSQDVVGRPVPSMTPHCGGTRLSTLKDQAANPSAPQQSSYRLARKVVTEDTIRSSSAVTCNLLLAGCNTLDMPTGNAMQSKSASARSPIRTSATSCTPLEHSTCMHTAARHHMVVLLS
jgi:hypothetical protein